MIRLIQQSIVSGVILSMIGLLILGCGSASDTKKELKVPNIPPSQRGGDGNHSDTPPPPKGRR